MAKIHLGGYYYIGAQTGSYRKWLERIAYMWCHHWNAGQRPDVQGQARCTRCGYTGQIQ